MPIAAGKYIWSAGSLELVPNIINGFASQKAKAKAIARAMIYGIRGTSLDHNISIALHAHCLHGANINFSNTCTALVAHYDKDYAIDHALIKQCLDFKRLGFKVVLCTHAKQSAQNALKYNFADAIIYRDCLGYDFTSWKAAFEVLPSLWQCTQLLLTNDSYFGPLNLNISTVASFEPVHAYMQKFTCDFWGMSISFQRVPHLQSYYMLLKQSVLQSKALRDFFAAVPLCNKRETAISQELSFSLWLNMHGFKVAAFCFALGSAYSINPSLHGHEVLLKRGAYLFKREALRSPHGFTSLLKYCDNSMLSHSSLGEFKPNEDFLNIERYFLRTLSSPNNERGVGLHGQQFPPHVTAMYTPIKLESVSSTPLQEQNIAIILHVNEHLNDHDIASIKNYINYLPQTTHIFIMGQDSNLLQALLLALYPYQCTLNITKAWPMLSTLEYFEKLKNYSLLLQLKSHACPLAELEANTFEPIVKTRTRKHMYASLLGNTERTEGVIHAFDSNKDLGCLVPAIYPPFLRPAQGKERNILQYMALKIGLNLPPHIAIDYALGGMFWCRPSVFKPLAKLINEYSNDFQSLPSSQVNHSLEKILLISCALQGKYWSRLGPVLAGC